jgi:hypothetical protein
MSTTNSASLSFFDRHPMPQDFCAQFRDAGMDTPVIYETAGNQSPEESLDHVRRYLLD